MELAVQYTRKRSEFGRHAALDDVPARLLASLAPSPERAAEYVRRQPCVTTLGTSPALSEHEANTETVHRRAQGMQHRDGGWPENVDAAEPEQVDRFLKRAAKEPRLREVVAGLAAVAEVAVRQNNTIDAYEEYFAESALGEEEEARPPRILPRRTPAAAAATTPLPPSASPPSQQTSPPSRRRPRAWPCTATPPPWRARRRACSGARRARASPWRTRCCASRTRA